MPGTKGGFGSGRVTGPRGFLVPGGGCGAVRILLECILVWQDIWPKLHQNERNWTEKESASLEPPPPLDPPSVIVDQLFM